MNDSGNLSLLRLTASFKRARFDTVQRRQIRVEHNLLATNHVNVMFNSSRKDGWAGDAGHTHFIIGNSGRSLNSVSAGVN